MSDIRIPIKERITVEELLHLRNICMDRLHIGEVYELRNAAKLRAVNSTKTYEDFKDIVDAAHLLPITKQDKMNAETKNRIWNSVASASYLEE